MTSNKLFLAVLTLTSLNATLVHSAWGGMPDLRAYVGLIGSLAQKTGRMSNPARSCSTLAFRRSPEKFVAKSFDWSVGHGYAFKNQAQVQKVVFPTSNLTQPVRWTSKYGSLTFNQMGRDMPSGGMNEGLVIESMLVGQHLDSEKGHPELNELQWIQYQLDNYKSVAEVVKHVQDLTLAKTYANVHYMVCDRGGECASIEFISGKAVVHHTQGQGSTAMPASVLTNNSYATSVSFLSKFQGFGGNDPTTPPHLSSLGRFVTGAQWTSTHPQSRNSNHSYLIEALKSVGRAKDTQWNIIYNLRDQQVLFKTAAHPALKQIKMSALDFSSHAPTQVLDINHPKAGDVSQEFSEHTTAVEQELAQLNER